MVGDGMGFATIVASNYLAHARTLVGTLAKTHPGTKRVVLLIDGAQPETEGDTVWVGPETIGVTRAALHAMAAMYDVVELATALKPLLLRWLLDRHDTVLYLDPDIEVFAPLHDLAEAAARTGFAVTPHRLTPALGSGRPVDRELLVSGAFNAGFVGVGRAGRPFLSWWADHLATDCVVAPEEGLFVDQRWLDLAAVYYPHAVIRDPGCNVAWWNIDERNLRLEDGVVRASDQPLRFFHFSGFDPAYPEFLYHRELHHHRPALVPPGVVESLVAEHSRQLAAAGWESDRRREYAFARAADGMLLTPGVRRAFRWAYRASLDGGAPPPDPFDTTTVAAFKRWATPIRRTERVLRMTHSLYRRVRKPSGSLARYMRVFTSEQP